MYRLDLVSLAEKILEQGLTLKTSISGQSMEPTAYNGDKVVIEPLKSVDELKKDMIVAMLSPDGRHFVLHRILHIDHENMRVFEKGDNCKCGKYVGFNSIKGIVVKIDRKEV